MSAQSFSPFVCLLLMAAWFLSAAEGSGSEGREFVIGFMENWVEGHYVNPQLLISTSSSQPVQVLVICPNMPWVNTSVVVSSPHSQLVTLPLSIYDETDINGMFQDDQGVYVQADGDVTVQGINKALGGLDMYLALPLTDLGLTYRVMTYRGHSEYVVVAHENNTTISIVSSGRATRTVLDRFQTIHMMNMSAGKDGDFAGTEIVADKPVAVISGNRATEQCLAEMMMPTSMWGTVFSTTHNPFGKGGGGGDLFRFVASENDTTVVLGNGANRTLSQAGDFWEVNITYGDYFTVLSSKPIMAAMLIDTDTVITSLMLLVPQDRYRTDYSFGTVEEYSGVSSSAVSVIINGNDMGGLVLDGQTNLNWKAVENITGSEKVHLWMDVKPGFHHLTHTNPFIRFFAFLSGDRPTYSSPAGYDKGFRHHCEVSGDPHLKSFAGQRASLAIPCAYTVTMLRVTNFLYVPGVPYYPEIMVKVHAGNSQRALDGRYYVSDISVEVMFFDGTTEGPSNTYITGEYPIEDGIFWTVSSIETMQERVRMRYDPDKRLATLEVTHTTVLVKFRPVNRSEGTFHQTQRPGVFIEVGTEDLIYNSSIRFPETLCSTLDDTSSFHAEENTMNVTQKNLGLYAVLQNMAYNIRDGDQDPLCPTVVWKFMQCGKEFSQEAFTKCAAMMMDWQIVVCFQSFYNVTRAIEACLDTVCNRNSQDACALLRDFTQQCQPMEHHVADIIAQCE